MTTTPPSSDSGNQPIQVLDLFAGVGGLSQGFREGDPRYRTVAAVESEPRAAAGYALNHGADVHVGSIQEWLSTEEVPSADIVIGGPPCQGFSALGARRADDERNSLWRHYAEAVRRAGPRYFVLENVPQFHRSAQFPLFESMTEPGGDLADYAISAHTVNAAEYGTAQVRKRIIVVGHHRDLTDPGIPPPETDRSAWTTLADVIRDLPVPEEIIGGRLHGLPDGTTTPGPYRSDELHVTRTYSDLSRRRFAAIPFGGNRFDLPDDLLCEAWRHHPSGSGDVMGRLRWNQPSVTIRTEFTKPEKGRYLHPVQDRSISPHEGARIQGFPDDYRFVGPITQIVKQIGNAVPIPLGRALGAHLAPLLTTN